MSSKDQSAHKNNLFYLKQVSGARHFVVFSYLSKFDQNQRQCESHRRNCQSSSLILAANSSDNSTAKIGN